MSEAKAKIRKGTLFNRRLLKESVLGERNLKLEKMVLQFVEAHQIKSCHIYLPIELNKEFDTWGLVKTLHRDGVKVLLSVSDFKTYSMSHFYYSEDTTFSLNKFNIPEPVGAQVADVYRAEMVLIPLLAADKKGHRIGYGKGFYDRLLAGMSPNVLKVGVNLAPLFDAFDFAESHDIRLDYCITPHEIHQCHD